MDVSGLGNRRMRLLIGLAAAIASAVLVSAQESTLNWIAAANGRIPESAIETGHGGRAVYICRGMLGGTQLGKIAVGFGGCSGADEGRGVPLKSYEGLAHPPRRVPDSRRVTAMRDRAAVEPTRLPPTPAVPDVVPPTPPDSST